MFSHKYFPSIPVDIECLPGCWHSFQRSLSQSFCAWCVHTSLLQIWPLIPCPRPRRICGGAETKMLGSSQILNPPLPCALQLSCRLALHWLQKNEKCQKICFLLPGFPGFSLCISLVPTCKGQSKWRLLPAGGLLQCRHEIMLPLGILLFHNPSLIRWQGRQDHVRAPAAHLGWMRRHKFAQTLLCFCRLHNNHKIYHLK